MCVEVYNHLNRKKEEEEEAEQHTRMMMEWWKETDDKMEIENNECNKKRKN